MRSVKDGCERLSLLRQGRRYAVVFNNCNAEVDMNWSFDDRRKDPLHECKPPQQKGSTCNLELV